MDLIALHGKAFTLWLTDDADESVIFSGTSRWDGKSLFVEMDSKPNFEVRPEWYQRIFPVKDQQSRKILFGADYCLRLHVGKLELDGGSNYQVTGLKWPEDGAKPNHGR